ncbi:hypothetical protein BDV10DRAFT_116586 [Aspergillus recurvatus]
MYGSAYNETRLALSHPSCALGCIIVIIVIIIHMDRAFLESQSSGSGWLSCQSSIMASSRNFETLAPYAAPCSAALAMSYALKARPVWEYVAKFGDWVQGHPRHMAGYGYGCSGDQTDITPAPELVAGFTLVKGVLDPDPPLRRSSARAYQHQHLRRHPWPTLLRV